MQEQVVGCWVCCASAETDLAADGAGAVVLEVQLQRVFHILKHLLAVAADNKPKGSR